jgi:D-serine deaminase-like pyridoxal phosphate-dependent protein
MVDAKVAERLESALSPHVGRLLTPALVIDLDAAEHNVRAMIARAGHPDRWRPHVKTVKQSAIVQALLAAGVRQAKCSTLDELALVLETAREREVEVDVLLAYPPSAPVCAGALALRAAHPRSTVQLLADGCDHLAMLDDWVASAGAATPVDVFLDVDVGMHRTGASRHAWSAGKEVLRSLASLRVVGLHGYDGHIEWHEEEEAHRGYDALCELARELPRPDDLRFVITSGTHSYAHALAHPGLADGPWRHQVSPGTVVLSDLRSKEAAQDLGLQQAAFVASRVISTGEDRVTLDAGSKALAPDMPPPACAVIGWPHLEPMQAHEEHRPARIGGGPAPALGTLLFLVPDHVCTTVNLYSSVLYVRGDELARGGSVEAAGHSLWLTEAGPA